MDYEVFEYICYCQYLIFGIPVRILKNDRLVKQFAPDTSNKEIIDKLIMSQLVNSFNETSKNVEFFISPDLLAFGLIRCKQADGAIVLGPCRSVKITDKTIKDIIQKNGFSQENLQDISDYLNTIPLMQFGRFAHTLSFINACINQNILKTSEFYSTNLEYKVNPSVFKNVLDHNEKVVYSEISKHNISDFEQRLLYFITNGMTHQIKNVWVDVLNHTNLPISANIVRHTKNECISSVSLFCRAAINGGLDSETAYELRDIYIDQIEKNNDITALTKLRYNIIIDFTERVKALQFKLTDNPAINRAINYIIENIEKKLTVTELANLIHMNGAYFSIKFKETLGMPLIDFIHMQKTSEAKRLLKFSTKTLVEISTYLSFSSQSYFQKVFKKFAGTTPKEYRNNKEG